MSGRREPDWLAVQEALERILSACKPVGDEQVDLVAAAGRTLAEDVVAAVAHPAWDNSGMDGFAVRSADIAGAGQDAPATLAVVEDIPAGHVPSRTLMEGEAARIMTGARIPAGADSVVRVEHTDAWQRAGGAMPKQVVVLRHEDAGRNIRRRGEDVAPGDVVLQSGIRIDPAGVGVLTMVGRQHVRVRRLPRVGIISTGDELAGPEDVEDVLDGRRIADSNSPALAAAVRATGCEPVQLGLAPDRLDAIRDRITAAEGLDALITTAGASVGEHDLVKDALEQAGYELGFWRVRMRPGSPFSFGTLGGCPVFGLAGNPVSALVTFEVLVRPGLRKLLGRSAVYPGVLPARCGERMPSKQGLTHFLRVRLEQSPEDLLPRAFLTGAQGSGMLTSVARADGLLVVHEFSSGVEIDAAARVLPLDGSNASAPSFLLWAPDP